MEGCKKCSKCTIEKPISSFSKRLKSTDQLQRLCKSCDNQRSLQWKKYNKNHYNIYYREKYANDVIYKVAKKLRSRLRKALLNQLTNKKSKTEDLLGICFEEFKEYIEFLMTSEMTWEPIDLDHVRPLSSFDLTNPEQLKEACHFSNIQPLLKTDNRKKGSRYHEHDSVVQRNNLYEYEYFKYYCCYILQINI